MRKIIAITQLTLDGNMIMLGSAGNGVSGNGTSIIVFRPLHP